MRKKKKKRGNGQSKRKKGEIKNKKLRPYLTGVT
jgi:hypothetical protein